MSNEQKPTVASPGALAQFVRTLRLVWRLMRDERVPLFAKLIPVGALAYVVSPIDLLPDFVLGLGQVDDLGVALLGIALFIEMCPRAIVDEHRAALDVEMRGTRPEGEVVDGTYRVVDTDENESRK